MTQDRSIKIISVNHRPRRILEVKFAITDPNPNARYNLMAYLQSFETKETKEIDALLSTLEAKEDTKWFNTKYQDGSSARDGTYNLILGAVTILNGKPFTIQHHVQIRLGAQPKAQEEKSKPKLEQKAERRIEISRIKYDERLKEIHLSSKIIDPSTDRKYDLVFFLMPEGGKWDKIADWPNLSSKPEDDFPNLQLNVEKYPAGKYFFTISGRSKDDIQINSETKVIEIKPQTAKKAEEIKVDVVDVKPKLATAPNVGVPVGTTVDYTIEIRGGEPNFTITRKIIAPSKRFELYEDTSKSNSLGMYTRFDSPGSYTIEIIVADKDKKIGRATIPIYVFKR
jgi:hypothetical protein